MSDLEEILSGARFANRSAALAIVGELYRCREFGPMPYGAVVDNTRYRDGSPHKAPPVDTDLAIALRTDLIDAGLLEAEALPQVYLTGEACAILRSADRFGGAA